MAQTEMLGVVVPVDEARKEEEARKWDGFGAGLGLATAEDFGRMARPEWVWDDWSV